MRLNGLATPDGRRVFSLRWRILILALATSLLVLGLAVTLSIRQARHEVQELMDSQMAKTAALIFLQAQRDPGLVLTLPEELASLHGQSQRANSLAVEFQIGRADGTIVTRSAKAPKISIPDQLGFDTVQSEGVTWRSLTLESADGARRIQVAQSVTQRNREAMEIARKTVRPLFIFFPLLLATLFYSVRRGLKPLDDLAHEVILRSPENLSPLVNPSVPREAAPLIKAINRLFRQVFASLENERRFTSDAAHELRTPLAAIRIQAQVAMLSEEGEARCRALQQVVVGIDRSTRLVEQMLRLARLDPLQGLPEKKKIALPELVRTVATAALEQHPAHRIEASLDESLASIEGDDDLLQVALRNLIDNAMRYSPAGSLVDVSLCRDESGVRLSVLDEGPGVGAENLSRLGERFYRGDEGSGGGCGLGLAIVRRICELHGAVLELANRPGGGFSASLRWPAAPTRCG